MRIRAAGFSHVGMKRAQNQDNFLVAPELNLFVVADGMGGHKGGETASQIAVSTIGDYFRAMTAVSKPGFSTPVTKASSPHEMLYRAIETANQAIQSRGHAEPALQGMGTTTVSVFFDSNKIYIGHVGDSRAYLIRPNQIWQLTRDHSLVQEKLRAGLITRAQLRTDRMKNVITRSVGFESDVDVDVYQLEPILGDVIIVCSDGLSGMLEDSQILAIVEENLLSQNQIDQTAQKLIDAANSNGGDDNVTAIVLQVY